MQKKEVSEAHALREQAQPPEEVDTDTDEEKKEDKVEGKKGLWMPQEDDEEEESDEDTGEAKSDGDFEEGKGWHGQVLPEYYRASGARRLPPGVKMYDPFQLFLLIVPIECFQLFAIKPTSMRPKTKPRTLRNPLYEK